MKKSHLTILFLVIVLAILVGPFRPAPVAAEPVQQGNLLNNGSLEQPYSNGAAQGWGRWHEDTGSFKPPNCSDRYAFRPKWEPESNTAIVFDGATSQHVGNQFDTWHGGVMQNVAVTPGTTYRFTFYATGRATNEQWPAASNTEVNMGVQAGIDPNGSGLWNDSDIVWGAAGSPHMSSGFGNWQQFSVETTATGNQITVLLAANFTGANQCRAHLDIWFDKAELVAAGPAATATSPPPPPQPTSPPLPPGPVATNTPLPTEVAQVPPTETPLPTATPTETPIPGGTICVNAFADNNANGQHDADEGAMAGVTFTVASADNQLVGQGVSSGPDPVCFEGLPPGTYQIAQQVPPALEMTTAANVSIQVSEGQTVLIEFGSRIRAEATATTAPDAGGGEASPTPAGPEDGGGLLGGGSTTVVAAIGLGILCLAVLLLGGLIFFLIRQRG
jgi:hypothetical protein